MIDIVKLYNPANAGSLTPEELSGLQKLDSTQIKTLALAYPNMTMQRAYLLIVDSTKPPGKQLPTLSSFENLWNLREKNGLRNYVAFAFKGTYKATHAKSAQPARAKKTEVLDLSETELLSLPGFKKSGIRNDNEELKKEIIAGMKQAAKMELPEKVKVTKIKKVPITAKTKKSK